MAPATRCLAVDDHPSVRDGLALMFGDAHDLELVGSAATGEEALEAVERLQPEVVIMDVRLPGIDGISAVKRVAQRAPSVKTVIFSAYGDRRLLSDAISAGARGYVMKGSPPEDLMREILQLLAEGLHTEEVGRRIGLSAETVKSDTKRAIQKLQAGTRVHAVAIALRSAFIE
jgi:DNA-binding NarL/FixJ family response regulator